jgi:hypothetical protein
MPAVIVTVHPSAALAIPAPLAAAAGTAGAGGSERAGSAVRVEVGDAGREEVCSPTGDRSEAITPEWGAVDRDLADTRRPKDGGRSVDLLGCPDVGYGSAHRLLALQTNGMQQPSALPCGRHAAPSLPQHVRSTEPPPWLCPHVNLLFLLPQHCDLLVQLSWGLRHVLAVASSRPSKAQRAPGTAPSTPPARAVTARRRVERPANCLVNRSN